MIEEFDKLAITTDNYDKLSEREIKEREKKREELLKKMNNEEINELLERPYPLQYRYKISKYLK